MVQAIASIHENRDLRIQPINSLFIRQRIMNLDNLIKNEFFDIELGIRS